MCFPSNADCNHRLWFFSSPGINQKIIEHPTTASPEPSISTLTELGLTRTSWLLRLKIVVIPSNLWPCWGGWIILTCCPSITPCATPSSVWIWPIGAIWTSCCASLFDSLTDSVRFDSADVVAILICFFFALGLSGTFGLLGWAFAGSKFKKLSICCNFVAEPRFYLFFRVTVFIFKPLALVVGGGLWGTGDACEVGWAASDFSIFSDNTGWVRRVRRIFL